MSTLLLIRSEIESLLDPMTLLAGRRQAFIDYSTSPAAKAHRVRSQLPGLGTATVLFPGTTTGVPAYSVKVHAKFPGQSPAIRGVLCVCTTLRLGSSWR
jgi:alanine dehydrogenase